MTLRNYDIAELRRLDVAHHLPAQQDYRLIKELGGSRIITRAEGCTIYDTTATNQLLSWSDIQFNGDTVLDPSKVSCQDCYCWGGPIPLGAAVSGAPNVASWDQTSPLGAHVTDARTLGGQVLTGGDRATGGDLDQGWFFSPTVICGRPA